MEIQQIIKKTKQFIEKNQDLISQKKYYEFAQKVKLMSNRKFQSKKINQSIVMLSHGADALLSISQVQQNIPMELLAQLVQSYALQPALLTQEQQKNFIRLIQLRSITPRKIQLLYNLIRKTNSKQSRHLVLVNYYVDFCTKNCQFELVQQIVSEQSQEKCESFVQSWTSIQSILQSQIPAIWCRMVLLRAVNVNLNDAQQLFRKVTKKYPNDDPYTVFTGFLLKSVALNSRQAYATIGNSYQTFLICDKVFAHLYQKFGQKFFGIEKKSGGIMSLIS